LFSKQGSKQSKDPYAQISSNTSFLVNNYFYTSDWLGIFYIWFKILIDIIAGLLKFASLSLNNLGISSYISTFYGWSSCISEWNWFVHTSRFNSKRDLLISTFTAYIFCLLKLLLNYSPV
jgi:hypothetical protein